MGSLLLALTIFSAQLLAIVSVAAIAEALVRVTDPRLRLAFWRGVALACLALPFLAIVGPESSGSAVSLVVSLETESASARGILPKATGAIGWLLSAGALVRLSWLGAGVVRLRQLRQRSRTALLTADLEAIRSDIAPRAQFRVSGEVAQPAGFGMRHPIILLPQSFFAMDPTAQRTVACHELLHVARRDWPWIVVEEVARALFWFHPAIWWLVERIQESREQLVDHLVIARTSSKRAYMSALVTFADAGRPLGPATAFLKRRHLRSRLQMLGKEAVMSRRRFVWTSVVLVGVVGGAIAGAVVVLPLGWSIGEAGVHAQQVVNGTDAGVTNPELVSEVKPQYTPEAMQAKIEGGVWMNAVVRTDGTPSDIEIIKSLDTQYALDKQAMAALSQWRFKPGLKDGKPVPVRVTVEMQFRLKK